MACSRATVAIASFLLFQAALGAQRTVFFYRESFGGRSWIGRYEVERSASGTRLAYAGPEESHRISLDADLGGLEWEWESADGKNAARAVLRGGTVFLEGRLGASPRRNERKTGGLPWYQAPDYSLSALAAKPTGSRQAFWMALPQDFSWHRMSARNAGTDSFEREGKAEPATRIVLTVQGVPEFAWKNEYWYSPEGEYLGFRGRRGGPLSPAGNLSFLRKEDLP